VTAASGARLCFGEPVSTGGRTVIPVARVRGGAGGGGGGFDAAPVGFIEVGPDGSRFEAIPDPRGAALAALRTGAALAATGGALAAALFVRRRRAALPRSRRRLLPR
jgi:hypothetical protein